MTTAATQFDRDTAVEPVAGGRLAARLGAHLSGFGGTHGGYVSALALRAMASVVDDPARAARSLTSYLLAPVRPDKLQLIPRLDRIGETMSSCSLAVEQDGQLVASALASFGKARESITHHGLAMPEVPPAGDCPPLIDKPVAEAGAGLLVEHRPAAPPLPLSGGDRAEILVWMRLVEDRPIDAFSATMLADAGPPALYGVLTEPMAMPSTEIKLHFADVAATNEPRWILGRFQTTYAESGYAVEDGELWGEDGRLVLQSRQLRRILRPR